jgi:hypothetical protein
MLPNVTNEHFEGPQHLHFQGQAVQTNNLSLLLDIYDGATVLQNVMNYSSSDMASHARRPESLIWFLFICLH